MAHAAILPITRFSLAGITALTITFLLFGLMHYLIRNTDEIVLIEGPTIEFPEIIRIPPPDTPLIPPERIKPPLVAEQPPLPPMTSTEKIDLTNTIKIPGTTDTGTMGNDRRWKPTFGDNDLIAIVKPQPSYPQGAIQRGIGGYAIVEFTVTTLGTTKDIRIIDAKPAGVFDRAAVRAAARFKYKPRVVEGKAVEVPGIQNRFVFEIED